MGITRARSGRYLRHIRGRPCLICGSPGEAHHLTYAQPRGLGLKSGDQYCVPLCHKHHMDLHQGAWPERTYWALHGIDPLIWAEGTYGKWARDNGIDTERGKNGKKSEHRDNERDDLHNKHDKRLSSSSDRPEKEAVHLEAGGKVHVRKLYRRSE